MIRSMRFGTTSLTLQLAAMLCFAIAATGSTVAQSAQTDATGGAQQAIEELVQLDEIQVRGKRLARAIEDAEDDFFARYNQLNRNTDYDVSCDDMRLSGSLVITRVCVPNFLAIFQADQASQAVSFPGCPTGRTVTQATGSYMADGSYQAQLYGDPCSGWTMQAPGPSAAAVAMHHRARYAANVMRVLKSDPQLMEKAGTLATLYTEMQQVQRRYTKVRSTR